MKDFTRPFPLFSLCGLNCGLCPLHHTTRGCPGCGGGAGHQSCAIVRCSRQQGQVEYCFLCPHYPCARYDEATAFDSFVPHRNMRADAKRAQAMGLPAYYAELTQKKALLGVLLTSYNDGRRKTFFCTAVNLLSLADVESVCRCLQQAGASSLPIKERAALAVRLFQTLATEKGVDLQLHRKPRRT